MSAAPTYSLLSRFPTQEEQRHRYDCYVHAVELLHQGEADLAVARERAADEPDNEELGARVDELVSHVNWLMQDLDVAMENLLVILPLPTEIRDSEAVVAVMGERRRPVPELI